MKKRLRQRWTTNLALLIVIAVLSVLIWLDEPPAPEKKPRLGQYLPAELASISIIRQGKQTIRFQKDVQSWRMISPYDVQADTARINSLLDIYSLEISTELESGQNNLDSFGLKNPAMQIAFNDQALSFGDTQPVGKRRYVLTNEHIFLVADRNFQLLNSSSTSYIDRHLIAKGAIAEKIMIGDRSIEKFSDGWVDNMGAKRDATNTLVNQWLKTKANWLTIAEEGELQGTPVTVTLTEPVHQLQFIVQKRDSGFVLIRPDLGLEYHLSQPIGSQLGLSGNNHHDTNKNSQSGE